jgi:ATP-dependent DNA helicase RecG
VVNAFYHRSYELPNPIEINIRNDYIEILSFPGPLPPVDQSALKKDIIVARNYRNRRIGDILKELRLTEGRGTGIAKIRKTLRQNGSPNPKFETDKSKSYFLTTIYIHPEFQTLKSNEKDEEPNDQEKHILSFCKTAKTKKEIFTMLNLSVNQKNHQKYIMPLLKSKQLQLLYPESPNHPKQKYVRSKP